MRKLRDIRQLAGLTQEDLEHESGVSQQYISQVETGKRELTEVLAQRLAPSIGLGWKVLCLSHMVADLEEHLDRLDDFRADPQLSLVNPDSAHFLNSGLAIGRTCVKLLQLMELRIDDHDIRGANLALLALHELTGQAHSVLGKAIEARSVEGNAGFGFPTENWRLEVEEELENLARQSTTRETPSDPSTPSDSPSLEPGVSDSVGHGRVKSREKAS